MLPTSMATPLPSMLAAWLMEVAVVRWSGGNHWLEMRGGAAMIVTPLTPFRMAQAWQLYIVKVSLTALVGPRTLPQRLGVICRIPTRPGC